MTTKKPKSTATSPKRNKSSTEKIFGTDVMGHGYTGIPNIMMRAQSRLGLNSAQFNILIQLLSYYMDSERPPYPTKRELRNRINVSDTTLKKHIRDLEQAGFVRRQQRFTKAGDFGSNIYHLDGLINKLKKLVPDFDREREEHKEIRNVSERPNARRNAARKAKA